MLAPLKTKQNTAPCTHTQKCHRASSLPFCSPLLKAGSVLIRKHSNVQMPPLLLQYKIVLPHSVALNSVMTYSIIDVDMNSLLKKMSWFLYPAFSLP